MEELREAGKGIGKADELDLRSSAKVDEKSAKRRRSRHSKGK